MVEVKLLPRMTITEAASHAALRCYQVKEPEVGKVIDVEKSLFGVSHHTTLQHSDTYKTFGIEGIAIGDVTLGLHLVSPFYNSDQRSGRYAGKMFSEPDFGLMLDYVKRFWPIVQETELQRIEDYLRLGFGFYGTHKKEADRIAKEFLRKERPYISEKMLETTAPKVAQEQLRMFIPTIFPTGLDFTINLTALVAMYEEAWTPAMKEITAKMAEAFIAENPDVAYMFDESRRRKGEWAIVTPFQSEVGVVVKPSVFDCKVEKGYLFTNPRPEVFFPVDRLHFSPELMDNSIGEIKIEVEVSVATMGQDQRHRTIRRGKPEFTGNFYLPPILNKLGLGVEALKLMREWIDVSWCFPDTLAMILAPYGAMVRYEKKGSFNAVAHEQLKRLCFCAQEEIYNLSALERQAVVKECGKDAELLSIFQPPCYKTGKCAEGGRYCGRDLSLRQTGDYFPVRKV